MRLVPTRSLVGREPLGSVLVAALVLVALLCCSLSAWAQTPGVTILSPKADEPVRGAYALSATKPNPDEGWVSIVLTKGPGITEPQFLAAVISPYKYEWDTRVRQRGKRVYPDGAYTLQFSGHKPTGEALGTQAISAQVQNDVAATQVGEAIELRHQFTARERERFSVKCESRLQLPVQLRPLEAILGSMQSQLRLVFTESVMDVEEGVEATVRKRPREGQYEAQGQPPRLFPGLGRDYTMRARMNGLLLPMRPELGRFGFGELYIVLPSGMVTLGHKWTSEAAVMPEFSAAQRQVVPAQHVLEGFEWLHGQKCARIRTTYQYRGPVIMVVEGAGLNVQTTMQGERATYFAYETGKVLLTEETNQHRLQMDLEQVGKRPDRGDEDEDDEEEDEEDEEEEEEEEDDDENANAGRPWYVSQPTGPRLWRSSATMAPDQGTVLLAGLNDTADAGTVYFAQRPTVRGPTVRRPSAGRPAPGRAARGAPAAAVEGALVVDVPYEVSIRIERIEAAPTT